MTQEIDRTWDLTNLYAGFDDPAETLPRAVDFFRAVLLDDGAKR